LHRSADALAHELREQLVGRKQRVEEKRRTIEALVEEQRRLAIEIHNCETALQAMRAELRPFE
jgi:regulator of replication initiation timing